jgi:hypothetical protein
MNRDSTPALWVKSTRSQAQTNCVEVADAGAVRLVRDSKNPDGAILSFDAAQWAAFIAAVRDGQLG